MKKILPAIFGLLLLAMPTAVKSQFLFTTNADNTITITGYTNQFASQVTIPFTINTLPVTTIGTNAFFNFFNLTNVTIPGTVTSIDSGAFANCVQLPNITIPGSVTSIQNGTFADCYALNQRHNSRQRCNHRVASVLQLHQPGQRRDSRKCHQHRG